MKEKDVMEEFRSLMYVLDPEYEFEFILNNDSLVLQLLMEAKTQENLYFNANHLWLMKKLKDKGYILTEDIEVLDEPKKQKESEKPEGSKGLEEPKKSEEPMKLGKDLNSYIEELEMKGIQFIVDNCEEFEGRGEISEDFIERMAKVIQRQPQETRIMLEDTKSLINIILRSKISLESLPPHIIEFVVRFSVKKEFKNFKILTRFLLDFEMINVLYFTKDMEEEFAAIDKGDDEKLKLLYNFKKSFGITPLYMLKNPLSIKTESNIKITEDQEQLIKKIKKAFRISKKGDISHWSIYLSMMRNLFPDIIETERRVFDGVRTYWSVIGGDYSNFIELFEIIKKNIGNSLVME